MLIFQGVSNITVQHRKKTIALLRFDPKVAKSAPNKLLIQWYTWYTVHARHCIPLSLLNCIIQTGRFSLNVSKCELCAFKINNIEDASSNYLGMILTCVTYGWSCGSWSQALPDQKGDTHWHPASLTSSTAPPWHSVGSEGNKIAGIEYGGMYGKSAYVHIRVCIYIYI